MPRTVNPLLLPVRPGKSAGSINDSTDHAALFVASRYAMFDSEPALQVIRALNSHDVLVKCLEALVPLVAAYLKDAPSHPDNGKLADARDALDLAKHDARVVRGVAV